jgi:Tat protein translocase TatB subunit
MNVFSNVGITELIVILLLVLLVVGPERLPEMARQLAKLLRDARTAYENLTKDLGPELMSIEKTTREIRESVNSVRSIPKDMVGSVVKAAELEEAIADLKDVQVSVQETGRSVAQAGQMIRKPLDQTLESARKAIDPEQATVQTEVQLPEAGIEAVQEPVVEPAEEGRAGTKGSAEAGQGQAGSGAPAELKETDPGESSSQAITEEEAGEGPSPEAEGHEQASG